MQKRFTPNAGGVFPEWEEKTLGECMTLIASKGYKGKDLVNDESKAIMFSPSDIDTFGAVSLVKNAHISDELFQKSKEALVKNGDILFTKTASIGKVGYVKNLDHNATINPQIVILRANEDIDSYLLFCAVKTEAFKKQVRKISGGTTIKTMSQEALKKLKIKIPKSMEEQRKIAAAFAAYDEMIAVKTAKLETWQECKKRMVKEIFGRTKRFKDDDGREFPEWEEKTLGEITEYVRNGYSYKPDGVRTHKYKVTRIETISTGKINPEKLGSCKECDEKYLLKPGDILYSNINSLSYLGNTAIYKNSSEKIYHGMNLLCIRPKGNDIDADYLFAFLNSEAARKFVKYNAQRAVNQCSIKVSDVRNMRIPLPCMEEQQKIGSFLVEIDKEIEIQKEFIKTYAEGKRRMMRELIGC